MTGIRSYNQSLDPYYAVIAEPSSAQQDYATTPDIGGQYSAFTQMPGTSEKESPGFWESWLKDKDLDQQKTHMEPVDLTESPWWLPDQTAPENPWWLPEVDEEPELEKTFETPKSNGAGQFVTLGLFVGTAYLIARYI